MPFEYQGPDVVARFGASLFGAGRSSISCRREPTVSPRSGPPRPRTGIHHGTGRHVLTVRGDRISARAQFDNSVLPTFGLPRSPPSR